MLAGGLLGSRYGTLAALIYMGISKNQEAKAEVKADKKAEDKE